MTSSTISNERARVLRTRCEAQRDGVDDATVHVVLLTALERLEYAWQSARCVDGVDERDVIESGCSPVDAAAALQLHRVAVEGNLRIAHAALGQNARETLAEGLPLVHARGTNPLHQQLDEVELEVVLLLDILNNVLDLLQLMPARRHRTDQRADARPDDRIELNPQRAQGAQDPHVRHAAHSAAAENENRARATLPGFARQPQRRRRIGGVVELIHERRIRRGRHRFQVAGGKRRANVRSFHRTRRQERLSAVRTGSEAIN